MRDEQLCAELDAAARAYGAVAVPDVRVIRRRARQRRLRGLGAAFLVLVVIGGGVATFARSHVTSTYPAAPAGPRPPGSAPSRGYRVRLTAAPIALAAGRGAVYAVVPVSQRAGGQPTASRVARLSATTRTPRYSAPLRGGVALALTPTAVWFLAGSYDQAGTLYQLDPTSLAVERSIPLRRPAVSVAAAAGTLWAAGPGGLLRVDPATGQVTRAATGWFSSVSVDEAQHALYAGQAGGPGGEEMVVTRRELDSGTVLARSQRLFAVASGQVLAAPGGVWAVFATGMMGAAVHLRASDLTNDATAGGRESAPGDNALRASVGDGVLWLADGVDGVSCANARTGQLRATNIRPLSGAEAVVDGADLYVAEPSGLAVLVAPARCLG